MASIQIVIMCFVWISEQTAIISLYSINWTVFITEMECVYSAVRTGYLCIVQVNFKTLNTFVSNSAAGRLLVTNVPHYPAAV